MSRFSLQRWGRAHRHVHRPQQRSGASQGRGALRCLPSREELTAAEATHGANSGKELQKGCARKSGMVACVWCLVHERSPVYGAVGR